MSRSRLGSADSSPRSRVDDWVQSVNASSVESTSQSVRVDELPVPPGEGFDDLVPWIEGLVVSSFSKEQLTNAVVEFRGSRYSRLNAPAVWGAEITNVIDQEVSTTACGSFICVIASGLVRRSVWEDARRWTVGGKKPKTKNPAVDVR